MASTTERGQFTFYSSIFESARRIRNKTARADFYDAICNYALNGVEPDLDKLSDAGAIGFISAKPNLDASRKKAKSGKAGGSVKQTGSKQQANSKHPISEKENEKEVEKENEIEIENELEKENECYLSCGGDGDAPAREADTEDAFSAFGNTFVPRTTVTADLLTNVSAFASKLFAQYAHSAPGTPDRRYVFSYVTRYCADTNSYCLSDDACDLLEYAFETAWKAGHPAQWDYIQGIMDRLSLREIHTVLQARQYDLVRHEEV